MKFVQPDITRYTKREAHTYTSIDVSQKPLQVPKKETEIFELHVQYMHGAADGETKQKYLYSDIGKLLEHAMFLDRCIVEFPHGMGGDDGYWKVPGYEEFGEDEIPLDNEYCIGHASVEYFGALYIDKYGVEFPVTLK